MSLPPKKKQQLTLGKFLVRNIPPKDSPSHDYELESNGNDDRGDITDGTDQCGTGASDDACMRPSSAQNDASGTKNMNTESGQPTTKSISKPRFQVAWLSQYPWLEYNKEEGKMYCTLCKERHFTNTMAMGTMNLKASTLVRHTKNGQHQLAVSVPKEQENFAKAVNKALTQEEKAIMICMKVVYFLCKEVIPLSKYKSFIDFLQELETPNLSSLRIKDSIDYSSYPTALDLLKSISDTLDQNVTDKMKQSPVITLLTDESTDIVVHHKLVINCRIVDPTSLQPSTYFLTDLRLTGATGKDIFEAIRLHVEEARGIPIQMISGLGTDGASVMTGRGEGLAGHFLRCNPHLTNCHCSAHRTALVSEQAANSIPAMKEYQKTLENLYYHFRKSPVKSDKLLAVQKVLEDPQIKYREVHSVRWLSFYNVVEAVYRTFDSLITYLTEAGEKDPAAAGLKKKVATDFFIHTTYHLMDILQPIMRLNLFFQRKDVDIGTVQTAVDACTTDLTKLLDDKVDKDQPLFAQQLEADLVGSQYKGNHLIVKSKHNPTATKTKFLQALLANLEKRFPEKELMTAFSILSMKPISLLNSEELQEWGNSSLEVLLAHFGERKEHKYKDKESKEEKLSVSDAVVDVLETRREWSIAKQVVLAQHYPRQSTAQLWQLITSHHRDMFPNLTKLAAFALAHPVHTSDCERSFSVQNQVTTALRNRLDSEHCEQIMRLKIEGVHVDIDYAACLQRWRREKKRLIFKRC